MSFFLVRFHIEGGIAVQHQAECSFDGSTESEDCKNPRTLHGLVDP